MLSSLSYMRIKSTLCILWLFHKNVCSNCLKECPGKGKRGRTFKTSLERVKRKGGGEGGQGRRWEGGSWGWRSLLKLEHLQCYVVKFSDSRKDCSLKDRKVQICKAVVFFWRLLFDFFLKPMMVSQCLLMTDEHRNNPSSVHSRMFTQITGSL